MKLFIRNYSGLVVFIVVMIIGSITSRAFFSFNNIMDFVQASAETGLLAAGMMLVILAGGSGVDLSVGSNMAFGCMVAAMTQAYGGSPTLASVILAILACGAVGACNGLLITKGGLQPFVATMGTMIAARALGLLINQGRPVSWGIPESFGIIARGKIGAVFFPAVIWIGIMLVIHLVLSRTKYGRDLMAAGGNEEAARYSGINVDRVRLVAYTVCGMFTGLAGAILTSRLMIGEPRSGSGYEMLAIAAVVMGGASMSGGRGTAMGTLLGVLSLGAISNLLNVANVNMYLQDAVRGLIIFLAVLIPSFTQFLAEKTSRSKNPGNQ